jgi:ACS family glucarate transporter-like MFS transporter
VTIASATDGTTERTKVRFLILAMLFALTTVNYADRSTLSIAGTLVAKDLGLTPVAMGVVFSAFGWSYALGQIPGGWLLDRFGSKSVYGLSLFLWSLCTLLQAFVGALSAMGLAVAALFALRFTLGLVESPAFPANGRITAAWFPTAERGTATSIFNSAQYAAAVIFLPTMGVITSTLGWPYVFIFMGSLGLLMLIPWVLFVHDPRSHPRANQAELDYIEHGGALIDMDSRTAGSGSGVRWSAVVDLLANRMLLGVYVGQYCITALTYFFITWFPIYLVQGRGLSIMQVGFVAALPAICGFSGGVLGGVLSDSLLRRGQSLTIARKTPFVLGMSLAACLVVCNFIESSWAVVAVMALAFFGKGLAAIGWAVISDTSPKEATGLCGGIFNAIGNIAGVVTPITIGYILQVTGSFNGALWFVAAHCLLAMFSYLVIVGKIGRVALRPAPMVAGVTVVAE